MPATEGFSILTNCGARVCDEAGTWAHITPEKKNKKKVDPQASELPGPVCGLFRSFSMCFFLCSFKLASQFSSCSVCSMTSTSFWQDGQAEISIQKARDLALLKPNARIFKPRQFRGIVRVLDESRQEAGRVTKLRNILVVD